jgi:hypothetical protein
LILRAEFVAIERHPCLKAQAVARGEPAGQQALGLPAVQQQLPELDYLLCRT